MIEFKETRAERRGRRKQVWNETLKKMEHYRLSARGKWILTFPFSNSDVAGAAPLSKREMLHLENPKVTN